MNRRVNTQVVDTGGAITNTVINKDASEVWWISMAPEAHLTAGLIQIYDGFDAGGKLVWQQEPSQARHENFVPPIHCEQGVFVYTTAAIACYTIAWRPKKWDRPRPMRADVIEHPEA